MAPFLLFTSLVQSEPLKVLPLGDSITELGCWRAYLYRKLYPVSSSSILALPNTTYIGSQSDRATECPGEPYPKAHEGHSGHQAIDIANRADYLEKWLQDVRPDVVLMHLGTVDIVFGKAQADILAAFDRIVDMLRAKNPKVILVVCYSLICWRIPTSLGIAV